MAKDKDQAAEAAAPEKAADKAPAKKLLKIERVHFHVHHYQHGALKYAAGKHYPRTPETESQVVAGNAKHVSVEMDADEHEAEHAHAHAAWKDANKATLAAEADARKRGLLPE